MVSYLNSKFKLILLTILFFILFYISLIIRGVGFDGDSIVNILQFYKIINQDLYNLPDGGTTPKLFLIILFGSFHYIFDSYNIHIMVFIVCSYSFAKFTLISPKYGGGYIWIILPFLSPIFLNSIMSANNPALSVCFYLLSLSYLFEKKINLSFIFLLLSELSRPGYSVLMFISLLFLVYIDFLNFKKDKQKIIFIIILILVAFLHSFFCYKLSYSTFTEYNDQNWGLYPGDKLNPNDFISNKIDTVLIFFKGMITAFFSNLLFPFPVSIISFFLLIYSIKIIKEKKTIILFLPVIYFPMLFAGITKGTIVSSPTFPKLLPKFEQSLDPFYFITILPMLMIAISLSYNNTYNVVSSFFENRIEKKSLNTILIKTIKALNKYISFIVLAFILSVINGFLLKDKFDYNPTKPRINNETFWLSSEFTKKIFKDIYSKKQSKLNILLGCDPIPTLIDNAQMIGRINFISTEVVLNKDKKEFIKLCDQGNRFLKRKNDILLQKDNKVNVFDINNYDLIYLNKDITEFLDLPKGSKAIEIGFNRVILLNDD